MDLGEEKLSDEDLPKIEEMMLKIANDKPIVKGKEVSYKEALEIFKHDEYKLELLKDLEGEKISIYTHDEFVDLCRGRSR